MPFARPASQQGTEPRNSQPGRWIGPKGLARPHLHSGPPTALGKGQGGAVIAWPFPKGSQHGLCRAPEPLSWATLDNSDTMRA